MRHIKLNLLTILPTAFLLLLSGCLGPGKSKPTRFYELSSLYNTKAGPEPVADLQDVAIGVGPVRIPGKLDRPQIVIRSAQNEIRRAEFAEWGDPLEASFARVLAENLSILLNTEKMAIFPWLRSTQMDYQVTVDVIDFIGTPGGDVVLRAWWTLFGKNGRIELSKRFANLNESGGDDIAAMVQAQSRLLEILSRQIAESINSFSRKKEIGSVPRRPGSKQQAPVSSPG